VTARDRNLALTKERIPKIRFPWGQASEKSQKLGMQRRRQIGALVEKSRAAIGPRSSKGDHGKSMKFFRPNRENFPGGSGKIISVI